MGNGETFRAHPRWPDLHPIDKRAGSSLKARDPRIETENASRRAIDSRKAFLMVRPGRGNGWRFPFSQATPTTNEATTTEPPKWSTRGWRQGIEREPRDFTSQPTSGKPKRRQPSGGDVSEYEEEVEIKQRYRQGEECWQRKSTMEGQAGEVDPMQAEGLPESKHDKLTGQQFFQRYVT